MMRILIDGYNLLYASAIFATGPAAPTLRRTREALLSRLAQLLGPDWATKTTVVFDAREAPPGLPQHLTHQGLTVRFAPRNSTADELITDLIRSHHAPRQLTLVSSDHRVQVAAKRRQATAVDSDVWLDQLRNAAANNVPPARSPASGRARLQRQTEQSETKPVDDAVNPFPPGYGEDLLDDLPRW